MPFECPKCKSPVAREGQRFCYRCGHELNAYYDSLKIKVADLQPSVASSPGDGHAEATEPAPAPAPKIPSSTVVLDANAFDTQVDSPPQANPRAGLKILLPTGDVFDRELSSAEIQIGKGPRNDIVIADPAVSSAHATIRAEGGGYTITDIGSRNGTVVNGERVEGSRALKHGDVIGVGLSKLTFRLSDYSETGAIPVEQIPAAVKPAAPPPLTQDSLATAVVEAGLAKKPDVDRLRGDGSARRLYTALVEDHIAGEEALRDLMSRTFEIPVIDLHAFKLDKAVAAEFPANLAREHGVFACAKEGEAVVLAVADPTDTAAVELAKHELRTVINVRLATASQIREQINRHYAPRLIGVLPSGEKLEYPIDKHEVEIGKASHNHIVLTDRTVSNTHAIVLARKNGYSIVDLGSRNGTFVNSDRLGSDAHTLRHGDKIQLGQTVFTFRNPGETAANVTAVLSSEAVEAVRKRAGIIPAEAESVEAAQPSPEAVVPVIPATSDDSIAEPSTTEAADAEDDKGDKKKKKKKKKGKDERLKAAYISAFSRIFAQVIAVVLGVGLAIYVGNSMRSGGEQPAIVETTSKGKLKVKPANVGPGTPFNGGTFEASAVAFVPGASGVLFVDDNKQDQVFWMQLDASGRQVGSVKPVSLGGLVEDPEGITYDGTYFYVVGSQSKPGAGERNALVRFAFDPASQSVQKAETLTNLRDFLISNVPELKTEGDKKGSEGGLNIEGIAWDFRRGRWLLGLRSPLIKDSQALVVAIKLKNPTGAFSADNLQLAEPHAIALPLGGLGIRDIQYDPELNLFLIIAGAPEHHEKAEFTLWEWDGSVDQPPGESALRKGSDLDAKLKPEGVTHVEIGGKKFVLIVGDASGYFKLDYSEAP
jgi:pSer/pThr/pTyr-binding forkhead associated (FHA) protein